MKDYRGTITAALIFAAALATTLALESSARRQEQVARTVAAIPPAEIQLVTAASTSAIYAEAPEEQETPEERETDEGMAPELPFTEDEIIMLAKTIYREANVLKWRGTRYGVSYQARQAAVAWCALNRYDAGGFGDTLAEILSKPHQFAYRPDAEYTYENYAIARDVVERWAAEQEGETDSGRTLPPDDLYFEGDGRENHFRKTFEKTGETWGWTLPDPYNR